MRKIIEKVNSLLKKEKGTIRKDPGGKIKVCLLYPNIYRIGIGNLGFQTVYRLFNERKDVVCERSFLPSEEDLKEYENKELFSYESKIPLYEFDIIAFSLSFENDYPNIIKILQLSKIPTLRAERKSFHPLVIAGGVACFSNPEPFSEIFDVIFIGESEALIHVFLDKYVSIKNSSYEKDFKDNLKRELIKLEGFYIPEAYEELTDSTGKIYERKILWSNAPTKVKKVYCKDFHEKFSFSQIITDASIFSNMYLVETMRGCPFRCRFCLIGYVYNPVRKASIEKLKIKLKDFDDSQKKTIGLIAPSISVYEEIGDLIKKENIELSFTSLRADELTMRIIDNFPKRRTITLAPEAGSERLRRVLKKGISEEGFLRIVEKIEKKGIENLKLYFMIGLPLEREEDIDEIVKFIKKLRTIFSRKIIASISIFVPKPHTPFQWHRMDDFDVVREKLKKLKRDSLKIKGVNLLHEVPKYAYMEGYFSRGNRSAFSVIKRVSDGENFGKILEEVESQLYSQRNYQDILPWDFIEHEGITKELLWKEYKKALSFFD